MKETLLFGSALRGPEDHLGGERGQAGKRIDIEEETVAFAVELNCLALGRLDDARRADDRRLVSGDGVELIERPHGGHGSGILAGGCCENWASHRQQEE